MFKYEIDNLFTAKVTEYISKGYRIHTETMGGSQGEIAKVDLTNGVEIIRVLLDHEFSMKGNKVALKVGRNTDGPRGVCGTIWSRHLEILEEYAFCKVNDNYYVTPAEYETIYEKHWARRELAAERELVELGEAAKKIVLPFVTRQPKCKSVKLGEIERVYKRIREDGIVYVVEARGRAFRLY